MSDSTYQEQEEFWADLIPLIAAREVVPILGVDLLTVDRGGVAVPLYRVVAERLLARYGLPAPAADDASLLRGHHELNDAVCELDRQRKRGSGDCYLPVHEALRAALAEIRAEVETPQRQLAQIEDFRLFVTTTCDDVMAQALDAVRYGGRPLTEQVEYAPGGLPKDRRTDISELAPADQSAVLYLFGKAAVSPVYAVHDEDVLEFLHGLQTGLGQIPQRFFSAIRGANLLLIGCHFPDWLSRFLMRITAPQRLSEQRGRKDFVIDPNARDETEFVLFVENFARNTRLFPMEPRHFVAELLRRWQAQRLGPKEPTGAATPPARAGARKPAVFISYSRTDIEPVRVLYDELRRIAGDDIAWFDKSTLVPGDDWRARIMEAIEGCQLFLPVVSEAEEARAEGVFIEEWRKAVERSRRIDGRSFIVPVFVDLDAEANVGRYVRAGRLFSDIDFGFAPGGRLTPRLEGAIVRELRAFRG